MKHKRLCADGVQYVLHLKHDFHIALHAPHVADGPLSAHPRSCL